MYEKKNSKYIALNICVLGKKKNVLIKQHTRTFNSWCSTSDFHDMLFNSIKLLRKKINESLLIKSK